MLVPLLGACAEWGRCRGPRNCCASCDGQVIRRSTCECPAGEVPVHLCGKRSACAVDFFVGEGPASCCSSCDGTDYYESDSAACRGDDLYLHECAMESACFQTYQAQLLDATYLPFAPAASGLSGYFSAVWGDAPDNVWVVGSSGRLLHGGPEGWSTVDVGTAEDLHAIWGCSAVTGVDPGAEQLWVAGGGGAVHRREDDGSWSSLSTGVDSPLYGLWGSADGQVWAVGRGGTILHGAAGGERMIKEAAPTAVDLVAVWGAGEASDVVYAVGAEGTILRRDVGETWRAETSPTEAHLTGIWGLDGEPRWIVGLGGTLLRREAGRWRAVESPVPAHLVAVHGASDDDVWAVGNSGTILRYDGKRWARGSYFFGGGPFDLFGVWSVAGAVWVVGEEGTILEYARD